MRNPTWALIALALCAAILPAQAATDPAVLREDAFGAAQGVLASSAADALNRVGVQMSAGSGPLADFIKEGNRLADEADAMRRQIDRLADSSSPEAEAKHKALLTALDAKQKEQTAFFAKLEERFPAYAELIRPRPLRSQTVQAILDPNEAMLLIVPTQRATYLFALTDKTFTWHRSALTAADIETRVSRLRCNLDPDGGCPEGMSAANGFDRNTAFELYTELIKPVEDQFAGKKVLFTLTGGALQSLPLHVLVTDKPQGADTDSEQLRKTQWLIDRYALVTLPAVSSLYTLRCVVLRAPMQRHRGCMIQGPVQNMASGSLAFAGIGAPPLQGPRIGKERRNGDIGNFIRDGLAIPERLLTLPPLNGAQEELRTLAEFFQVSDNMLLTGSDATETAVKQDAKLHDARVLVFATHALMGNSQEGGEPGLVLAPPQTPTELNDGLLTASEVAALRLSAEFVVLSACNTARNGTNLDADGLAGLSRAFFYAGARALLVSHWPVFDNVPPLLMAEMFRNLKAMPQEGRAIAFQKAIVALKAMAGNSEPQRWAAFVLVGDTVVK